MTPRPIGKVVIAGRDIAAWMAALALRRALGPSGLVVEVVELPSLLHRHDLIGSQPAIEAFHRRLGIDEHDLLRACEGLYTLGQSFANFAGARTPFLHPFGSHGVGFHGQPFHQLWAMARHKGLRVPFEDFSLTAAAAKHGRFFTPDAETAAFARCDYGYSLNAAVYVEMLRSMALRLGVTTVPSHRVTPVLEAETGRVQSLTLADGRVIEGDFFIDASGAGREILSALSVDFEDWSAWFPATRVVSASARPMSALPAYTQVRALGLGYIVVRPTQSQTALSYAFRDGISDDQALHDLSAAAGLVLEPDAVATSMKPGRHSVAWMSNCVALGEAACTFDLVDPVALHAIQLGLVHLITLFPIGADCAVESLEYNRIMASAFENIRDFQITHFKLNQVQFDAGWSAFREMEVPGSLAGKIDAFASHGVMRLYDEETFQLDDWLAAFIGHGLVPSAYNPLCDLVPNDECMHMFQSALAHIKQQVEEMSSLDAYVEMFVSRTFA